MQNGIEGVAFDLDGTLYPNYRLNYKLVPLIFKEIRLAAAFSKARAFFHHEPENEPASTPPDFYQRQAVFVAKILDSPVEEVKEKIERLIYKAWEIKFMTLKPFPRALETLNALRQAGFKLGIMSDFPPETKLKYLGLDGLWDAELCTERCGMLKPHLLPFQELAAALALPPEKILYVGNSRSLDVTGACRAGMKTAWIKNPLFPGKGCKKPTPDLVFTDYRQLRAFMLD
jgi:putative hydrolase of the HAD superfamily